MNSSSADLEKKFSLSSNLIESLKDMIYTQHAVMSVSGTNLYEETLRLTKIIPTGIICFSFCIFFSFLFYPWICLKTLKTTYKPTI